MGIYTWEAILILFFQRNVYKSAELQLIWLLGIFPPDTLMLTVSWILFCSRAYRANSLSLHWQYHLKWNVWNKWSCNDRHDQPERQFHCTIFGSLHLHLGMLKPVLCVCPGVTTQETLRVHNEPKLLRVWKYICIQNAYITRQYLQKHDKNMCR